MPTVKRRDAWALSALGALALLNGCGAPSGGPPGGGSLSPQDVAIDVLRDVPQRDVVLGDPEAPDVLIVYSDPDGLRFYGFAQDVPPEPVRRHVRRGELRIQLAPLEAEGAPVALDERRSASRDVVAAARQNRAWDFALLYERFGTGAYRRQGRQWPS